MTGAMCGCGRGERPARKEQHGEEQMGLGRFPEGFVWGAATAAYQIEGAVAEDGRGPSIWDTFSHTPGKTLNGDTGDVACDHYHRWRDDIALMRALGIGAYRFSIAWPRVQPQGMGGPNEAGLAFYDRLVDGLLDAGITPFATLYHWDLPQALQDRGGWARRETADAFAAYVDLVARRLGDRVKHWITHNEPWVITFLGHVLGEHAPGLRDWGLALPVSHHLLLSHGRATAALRAARGDAQVGITLNLSPAHPATGSAADRDAARRFDGYLNRWFLDPLFGRGYPADMVGRYGGEPPVEAGDLAAIAAPIDFLGVNYYHPTTVRAAPTGGVAARRRVVRGADRGGVQGDADPLGVAARSAEEAAAAGIEVTAMGWPVEPGGLRELLDRLRRDYAPAALYITENGAAFDDRLVGGAVRDPRRVAYLHGHLAAAGAAIAGGVPLRGYFAWSLLDNFEWAFGYGRRFGLAYVDYPTQRRIPKDSFDWYRRTIAANAVAAPARPGQAG
jgi:beta-glucosidase